MVMGAGAGVGMGGETGGCVSSKASGTVGLAVGGFTGGCVGCNSDTHEASVRKSNIVEDELEAKLSLPKLMVGSIIYSNEPLESVW